MNSLRLPYGPSNGPYTFRAWLLAAQLCVFLASAPALFGQYVYESVSYSVGTDGTIYATGVTNAGGMQQHSAWVQTVISSPGGRLGEGTQSVYSGGYAVANASLAFVTTDLGTYTVSASGGGT